MRIALLGFFLIGGAAAAFAAPPASGLAPGARNRVTGALCDPARTMQAGKQESPAARKLGELPSGNVVLTVVREVDGCAEPVIVRYGIGGRAGSRAAPKPRHRR